MMQQVQGLHIYQHLQWQTEAEFAHKGPSPHAAQVSTWATAGRHCKEHSTLDAVISRAAGYACCHFMSAWPAACSSSPPVSPWCVLLLMMQIIFCAAARTAFTGDLNRVEDRGVAQLAAAMQVGYQLCLRPCVSGLAIVLSRAFERQLFSWSVQPAITAQAAYKAAQAQGSKPGVIRKLCTACEWCFSCVLNWSHRTCPY